MAAKTTDDSIVVTIDSDAQAGPAIALAAALAKARKRALRGLFIEDLDLLNVARLPFTREVMRLGRETRDLRGLDLERSMARLAAEFQALLESEAREQALRCSFSRIRSSKRLLPREDAALAELLVIAPPARRRTSRSNRILLLNGDHAAVLAALATVLENNADAELLVHGEFDAATLNDILARHPRVTRRLMGGPALEELLVNPRYRPSLVLMSRQADPSEMETCLRLSDCPLVLAASG